MLTAGMSIAVSATESDWMQPTDIPGIDAAEDADDLVIGRVICPGDLRGVASITLQASYDDGVTAKTIKDIDGNDVVITLAADGDIALPPATLAMIPPKLRVKPNVAPSGGALALELMPLDL